MSDLNKGGELPRNPALVRAEQTQELVTWSDWAHQNGQHEIVKDPTVRTHVAIIDLTRLRGALDAVLKLCDDPGGPNSWSHTFQGRQSVFVDDIRGAIEEALGGTDD